MAGIEIVTWLEMPTKGASTDDVATDGPTAVFVFAAVIAPVTGACLAIDVVSPSNAEATGAQGAIPQTPKTKATNKLSRVIFMRSLPKTNRRRRRPSSQGRPPASPMSKSPAKSFLRPSLGTSLPRSPGPA